MADKASVPNNIYTVLTVVALIVLLVGIIFVAMRSDALFGSWNPMGAPDLKPMSSLLPTSLQSLFC